MKRIFIILCLAALAPVLSVAQSKEELEALESEIEADWFTAHFIDRKYGGVVWSVNSDATTFDFIVPTLNDAG